MKNDEVVSKGNWHDLYAFVRWDQLWQTEIYTVDGRTQSFVRILSFAWIQTKFIFGLRVRSRLTIYFIWN